MELQKYSKFLDTTATGEHHIKILPVLIAIVQTCNTTHSRE